MTPDISLFLWLNATVHTPDWVILLARAGSQVVPLVLVAGTLLALALGRPVPRSGALQVVLAMALAWCLARAVQAAVPLPRPFALHLGTLWLPHSASASFPSTHATVAFAFGMSIAILARGWTWRLAALAIALWVAWSRICLGVHFPSDILAGALCGTLSAVVVALVLRRLRPTGSRAAAAPLPAEG